MILELTPDQTAFQKDVEGFTRDVVALRAAGIDKSGEFPTDVMHAAAQHGLLGVTIAKQWGGAGRDYVSRSRSFRTPAAVTAGPAPGPVMTSGFLR